jgi:hypothetical protein
MEEQLKGPFDAPDSKTKEKRVKIPKARIHIYISQGCIDKVDEKAVELGIDDRSPCVQFLLNYALNMLKNNPVPSDLEIIKMVSSS